MAPSTPDGVALPAAPTYPAVTVSAMAWPWTVGLIAAGKVAGYLLDPGQVNHRSAVVSQLVAALI